MYTALLTNIFDISLLKIITCTSSTANKIMECSCYLLHTQCSLDTHKSSVMLTIHLIHKQFKVRRHWFSSNTTAKPWLNL